MQYAYFTDILKKFNIVNSKFQKPSMQVAKPRMQQKRISYSGPWCGFDRWHSYPQQCLKTYIKHMQNN